MSDIVKTRPSRLSLSLKSKNRRLLNRPIDEKMPKRKRGFDRANKNIIDLTPTKRQTSMFDFYSPPSISRLDKNKLDAPEQENTSNSMNGRKSLHFVPKCDNFVENEKTASPCSSEENLIEMVNCEEFLCNEVGSTSSNIYSVNSSFSTETVNDFNSSEQCGLLVPNSDKQVLITPHRSSNHLIGITEIDQSSLSSKESLTLFEQVSLLRSCDKKITNLNQNTSSEVVPEKSDLQTPDIDKNLTLKRLSTSREQSPSHQHSPKRINCRPITELLPEESLSSIRFLSESKKKETCVKKEAEGRKNGEVLKSEIFLEEQFNCTLLQFEDESSSITNLQQNSDHVMKLKEKTVGSKVSVNTMSKEELLQDIDNSTSNKEINLKKISLKNKEKTSKKMSDNVCKVAVKHPENDATLSSSKSPCNIPLSKNKSDSKLGKCDPVTPTKTGASIYSQILFASPNNYITKDQKSPSTNISISPCIELNSNQTVKYSPKIQSSPSKFFHRNNMPCELLKTPVKLSSPLKNTTPRKRNLMNDFEESSNQPKIDDYLKNIQPLSKLQKNDDVPSTCQNSVPRYPLNNEDNVVGKEIRDSLSPEIHLDSLCENEKSITNLNDNQLLNEGITDAVWNSAVKLMNDREEMENIRKGNDHVLIPFPIVPSPKKSPKKKPSNDPTIRSDTFINYLVSNPMIKKANENNLFDRYRDQFHIFFNLSEGCQLLYTKHLFTRTLIWYRVEELEKKYKDNFEDIKGIIATLLTNKILTDNLKAIDLLDLLKLLKVGELKIICKHFNVTVNEGNTMKKDNLVQALLNHAFKQKTMFGNLSNKMKDRVIKELGQCVSLNEKYKQFVNLLVITATYPYYMDEEKKRLLDLIQKLNQIKWRSISYPAYRVRPDIAFQSIQQLEQYADAVTFVSEYSSCCEVKDWTSAAQKIIECKSKFTFYLSQQENIDLLDNLDGHLLRFTAGYQYAYCLSDGITVLKKDNEYTNECLQVLHLLLNQNKYLQKRKGQWFDELALVLQNKKKDLEGACLAVKEGLEDNRVDIIRKRVLSQRACTLIKRKTGNISDGLKAQLRALIVPETFTPQRHTISCMSHEGSAGKKQVFYLQSEGEKTYASVEEIVINYYKKDAKPCYSKGMHDEGRTLMNLILGCFYDVIYSHPDGPSVFHCEMQTHPLDWGGTHFYRRRKQLIQDGLSELRRDGLSGVMSRLENVCSSSENVQSVVSWDYVKTDKLPKIRELLECLDVQVFLNIAEHVIKDYKSYHSGFPDLIMWDPPTKQCLIVEVKGPNDKLSPTQTLWLENLSKFGANAIVCHVENVGTRKRKVT